MIICEKAYIENNKVYCRAQDNFCAHVKFCQLSMKWDQTRGAETCPVRFEEPKKGKKKNAKK